MQFFPNSFLPGNETGSLRLVPFRLDLYDRAPMEPQPTTPEILPRWPRLAGATTLVLLLVWQGWLTLGLFGPAYPWLNLTNDLPVVSGAHPQHQYLGAIGAQMLHTTGSFCAYDPAFQAGYPKTPIFNGSRLAEVCFWISGGVYDPAAYKIGIAIMCLLVPILLVLAARGFGLNRLATAVGAVIGIFIWWGPHSRSALEAGESDFFLAALAVLAHVGTLCRYDRAPGLLVWCGVVFTAALWLVRSAAVAAHRATHAAALLSLHRRASRSGLARRPVPGRKHGSRGQPAVALRLGLVLVAAAAPAQRQRPSATPNVRHGLGRADLGRGHGTPARPDPLRQRHCRHRHVAHHAAKTRKQAALPRLRRVAGAGPARHLLGAARSTRHVGAHGTALWFAAIPAGYFWTWVFTRLYESSATGKLATAGILATAAAVVAFNHAYLAPIHHRAVATTPLRIGLGIEHEGVVTRITETTSNDARILWEDRPLPRTAPRWSALLPLLTGRHYLGGLDPDGFIEHSAISFLDQQLDGLPIASWSDDRLAEYCQRYNVGWVVAWTPAAIKRFNEWDGVVGSTPVLDDVAGYLFTLKRTNRTFALKGQAKLIHADAQHITLGDLVPEGDVIVLSLHWQAGLSADPGRVQIEREPCGHDPIGFIRLRTSTPVARVTLTWGQR